MTEIVIEPVPGTVVARAGGAVIAETSEALVLREPGYDPVHYFPRGDAIAFCDPSPKRSHCPHKGEASYFHLTTKSGAIENAAWSYETPLASVAAIAGHIAFGHDKIAVEVL
ncbi:MAG: DUF427 domain-containing protein [Pseudomonadota bacterium]